MNDFLQIMLLASLPAVGNFSGGLIAEFVRTNRRTLSLALHLAAGIVFGVIAVELAPRAFGGAPTWMAGLGFLAGGATYLVLESVVSRLIGVENGKGHQVTSSVTPGTGGWMVYAAVAVDLFSDGLLIGTGSTISFELALLLTLGQLTADIPEGFATIANFKDKGVPRGRRMLLSASFALPILAGALLSYFVLRDMDEAIQLTALAFTAGLLLVAASEEIIGEAHDASEDTRWSVMAIVGGFVLFALVAGYFEA